jgi:hypothetical protein
MALSLYQYASNTLWHIAVTTGDYALRGCVRGAEIGSDYGPAAIATTLGAYCAVRVGKNLPPLQRVVRFEFDGDDIVEIVSSPVLYQATTLADRVITGVTTGTALGGFIYTALSGLSQFAGGFVGLVVGGGVGLLRAVGQTTLDIAACRPCMDAALVHAVANMPPGVAAIVDGY